MGEDRLVEVGLVGVFLSGFDDVLVELQELGVLAVLVDELDEKSEVRVAELAE